MEVPLLLFVGLILLLACSAFTSASEIAFFALSLNDLEELKKSNKKNDKVILNCAKNQIIYYLPYLFSII